MAMEETLRKIGLNDSEVKVYLALLRIGESKKSQIVKASGIAHSKIYVNLDKLIDKGLVSVINKNKINYYISAPVERVNDFLDEKKKEIETEQNLIAKIMPDLKLIQEKNSDKLKIEVFTGWKGMETAYSTMLNKLKLNGMMYTLGADKGFNWEKTKVFFRKYNTIFKSKKIKSKIIFNESARDYVRDMEKENKNKYDKKFLMKTTPVEISIAGNYTAIIMLKQEPVVILIKDNETAESFMIYFNELWKTATN
jgi:HTH-type transcriptional regulator, sugar sensing transcriptional regulator